METLHQNRRFSSMSRRGFDRAPSLCSAFSSFLVTQTFCPPCPPPAVQSDPESSEAWKAGVPGSNPGSLSSCVTLQVTSHPTPRCTCLGLPCKAGDPGLIPGSERSSGGGIGYPPQYSWASLVAQLVKNPSSMQETWVRSLGWEDHLE